MTVKTRKKIGNFATAIFTWFVGIAYFFPILYMFLTSVKSEMKVVPPSLWVVPTLENFKTVLSSDILINLWNSTFVTVVTMLVCLLFGIPAAYAIVFGTLKKAEGIFFWFISTNLLPPVGVLIPIFLIFKYAQLLDTKLSLIIVYAGANIPLVIWMLNSFFKEVPKEVLEACEIDGATRLHAFFHVILPLTRTGIISAALLVIIFVWNEFFFAVNLTYIESATLPVHMAAFMTQEGLFWAKLSAIASVVVLPPVILGWISQKAMVKGLTMGAVKG